MSVVEFEERYKSPIRKLLPFFERSRNGWKEKCTAAKATVKQLKNQTAKLQQSRQRWKELAKKQALELEQLRRELDAQKM
jgi:hypothetical protein